jgi:hypothetical protein
MPSKTPSNPARFVDMLDESLYATGDMRNELKSERQERVAWLLKKGKKNAAASHLAAKLGGCKKGRRCKSAACPECAHAAQRLIAKATRRFVRARRNDGEIVCVTVVPDDGTTKRGNLNTGEHERRVRRWKERLGKAGIEWFVGGTDLSFNEHAENRYQPHWSEHFYGVTVAKDREKLKAALKAKFAKTDAIPRPVKIKVWNTDIDALSYIFKRNFWRRIATDNATRFDEKNGTTRSCRDTDKQPLKSKRKLELLVHLDNVGMQGRLVLRCCQLLNAGAQGATIVMRLPKERGGR